MLKLSRMGVVICPPLPAFYTRRASIDEMVDHSVSRILDQLGIHLDVESLVGRDGGGRPGDRLNDHPWTSTPTFRPFVVAAFFLIMLIALPFRSDRSRPARSSIGMQEGLVMLVTLRLAGLALWVSVIAFMISPASMAWASLPFPAWIRWTGVGHHRGHGFCCCGRSAALARTSPTPS